MKILKSLPFILTVVIFLVTIPGVFQSYADTVVTGIQFNGTASANDNVAICDFLSPVTAGDTLVISLDASFIDHTTVSINDTQGNHYSNLGFVLNSASTWVQVWQAFARSSGTVRTFINFTSFGAGEGAYAMTCDEFAGRVQFLNTGGLQGGHNTGCNLCQFNMTGDGHLINLVLGWSFSSTFTFTSFRYNSLPNMSDLWNPKTISGSCQAINHGSNCILAFHGESNAGVSTPLAPGYALSLNCSPACNQSPLFVMSLYAQVTTTVTTTQYRTPPLLSWQFWWVSIFWNFGLGLLFVVIPARMHVSNGYLFAILFESGAFLGGILGTQAKITPWYDPGFFLALLILTIILKAI